ncbi:LytR/AlgR family response regulator transcription factor [Paenibacillus prosopidis]|uniref:LytTR family two component transcriptional regulator n=1 Tax=Paenibacillus prosopidis TaxID=630520 RepID=A0A368WCN8_9BACL|nr:LytTR family DNA-binding domain-containing protein [Paenibacillus prosopidis]RCW51897.1 LytTR family two component transcriptional regulator [Paenibacillus prosopidis]
MPNMPYLAVVAEDNPKLREELIALLHENGFKVVAEASSGAEMKQYVQQYQPHVLFTDIDLPNGNGISAAKLLRIQFPELCIVFITGFSQYASEAFAIEATDYIVKPFTHDRLHQCFKRIKQMIDKPNGQSTSYLSFRNRNAIEVIEQEQVVFLSAENKATKVYLSGKQGKVLTTTEPLKMLENRLDPFFFIRSHRSYIVNIKHIHRIEPFGQTFVLNFKNSSFTAHLSRSYLTELYNRLQIL